MRCPSREGLDRLSCVKRCFGAKDIRYGCRMDPVPVDTYPVQILERGEQIQNWGRVYNKRILFGWTKVEMGGLLTAYFLSSHAWSHSVWEW